MNLIESFVFNAQNAISGMLNNVVPHNIGVGFGQPQPQPQPPQMTAKQQLVSIDNRYAGIVSTLNDDQARAFLIAEQRHQQELQKAIEGKAVYDRMQANRKNSAEVWAVENRNKDNAYLSAVLNAEAQKEAYKWTGIQPQIPNLPVRFNV